jgi:hypothetical protein
MAIFVSTAARGIEISAFPSSLIAPLTGFINQIKR